MSWRFANSGGGVHCFVTSADGVPLAYEVQGTGEPPLVFVHGWSCDQSYWDGQIEPLSREFQVVAVDLAGHGESGLGRERWTIGEFGADVTTVVNTLRLDNVILIGHSMGGDVILEAALRLPGRVLGLIWVDVYRQLEDFHTVEQVRERMIPFRADFVQATREFVRRMFPPDADETLVERVMLDMSATPPGVALATMESVWNYCRGVPEVVRELGLPMVAINPAKPPTDIESMRRCGIEVVSMSGVGHFPMMEAPQVFNDLLLKVVRQWAGTNGNSRE